MDLSEVDQSSDDATLVSVAQHDFRLPPQSPASVLYAEFQRDPMLPGAIVSVGEDVIGLVSRQRFFQLLSHRFGASLFLDAPVQKILGAGPHEFLSLDETLSIHEAARRCLARPRDLVFEPVLVVGPHDKPRLLGMHELLLAQSHQLTLAHDTIQEQIGVVEAASQAKGNFLANMSHEIRTPLNAIVGMTELMLDSSLTPRQREYAGTVIDSCENLLAIINDVLDFSKIESGRLDLERVRFDLREHLCDTLKGMAVRACQRGVELAFRCAADVPREVVGDPVRLRQIVLNLVGNAIKFTHQGVVVVDVGVESCDENDFVLHFCVSDIAVQALQQGAASYVPKKLLMRYLWETIEKVLKVSVPDRGQARLLDCMLRTENIFHLESDPTLFEPLIRYLQEETIRLGVCTDADRVRVGVALEESLANALYHGNLGFDSQASSSPGYRDLIRQRRADPDFSARRIEVEARITRNEAVFAIRDEGNGFDPSNLPDPTDPANIEKACGRGIFLMRAFMDEVRYNDAGNVVVLVKRRVP